MNNRKAFTIVELLMVVTIIALLLGILLPAVSTVRTKAKETVQKAQFATIDMGLEAFKQDYGDYPPSDWHEDPNSSSNRSYCGAQKLTEALLGWDLAGFHPKTSWRRDGYTGTVTPLVMGVDAYDPCRTRVTDSTRGPDTLFERRGPYLDVAKTSVFRLGTSSSTANDGLYNLNGSVIFDATQPNYVICDSFGVKKLTFPVSGGPTKIVTAGTPVLYYKANTNSRTFICPTKEKDAENSIYNYYDNMDLLNLGIIPTGLPHLLVNNPPGTGKYFCDPKYKIVDQRFPMPTGTYWPNRPDTYILISAGADHEFGTNDDILNF